MPLLLAMGAVVGCGKSENGTGKNVLTGVVTITGKPAAEMVIVAVTPEGETAGGTTDPTGRYTIPDPPQGPLQVYFMQPGELRLIPDRYTVPNSELVCEYRGGKQTYDMDLKP
jgi:hypothetical protein